MMCHTMSEEEGFACVPQMSLCFSEGIAKSRTSLLSCEYRDLFPNPFIPALFCYNEFCDRSTIVIFSEIDTGVHSLERYFGVRSGYFY
jgi:hypothetical protein